ncbi:MAG: hypothetical protein U9R11_00470 [Chloroflexota bacterium]|nr:hypothetical protein [Chloroflexota bacterium]
MRIRVYILASALLLLLIALGGVLRSFFTDRPLNVQEAPARTIPNTDVNPYGANLFLAREVEDWKREKTVKMAAEAGIGWVKQQFPWVEIEPYHKGEFLNARTGESNWEKYDEIVALCERYGLSIIARLDRAPAWARPEGSLEEAPPEDFDDYGDFVYEFVKHYQGRIRYIQIWNEPNIFPEWGNRPVDPASYVELLEVAHRRAKEADPNVYVLSAPLAITLGEPHPEPGKWRSMSDLQFLEEMYKAGAKGYFDILSANAFGFDRPPDDPPDPNVLNFSRVLLQREIMERYDDDDKPIWFNEYGWNAAPEDFPEEKLIWRRVSEERQAEYTLQGIEMARAKWPWAGVFNIWYFRQVGNYPPDDAAYYFRMVDVDFTPRRLYYAIRDVAAALRVAGAGYYEESNPAVSVGEGWQLIIEPRASSRACAVSETPQASLSFAFKGDGVDLIALRDGKSGRVYVTLDGRAVSGLPVDKEGRSYVDLYSPLPQWQAKMPLVRGASGGQHVLRLMVSEEKNPDSQGCRCAVDAFEVTLAPPPSFPYLPVSLLSSGAVAVGWLLYRELRGSRRRIR